MRCCPLRATAAGRDIVMFNKQYGKCRKEAGGSCMLQLLVSHYRKPTVIARYAGHTYSR